MLHEYAAIFSDYIVSLFKYTFCGIFNLEFLILEFLINNSMLNIPEVYSVPTQASKMEHFAKIVNIAVNYSC